MLAEQYKWFNFSFTDTQIADVHFVKLCLELI